ncbi:cache domain-containing sensor histidine kinase [Paenibacillus marinisediminis]
MSNLIYWMKERYSRNIQTKLTSYFLLILLPLVVVSLFAIERSRDILYEQAVERTEVALSSAMNYIDLALQNVEEISTLIAADTSILKLLDGNSADLAPETIVNFSLIIEQLSSLKSVNRFVSQIAIYHQASNMVISTNFGGRKLKSEPLQEWMVETARANGTGISYILPDALVAKDITFGSMVGTDSMSLVRSMDLYNTERASNLLIVTFNKSKLLNVIRTLLPSETASISLYNEKGELVVGTGSIDETAEPPPISDKEMEVSVDSPYSTWRLTLIQPKKELYVETDQLRMFTFTIIVISILLAIGISWIVYSGIASPVQKLTRGMKRLRSGKLDFRLENNRRDEFGYLLESFNQMVQHQKHLIEDHYEQQLRLTTTELKFLQSQINPHFLYNTLDSIYWTAKNYEAEEISEMVMNLSKFFRLSLNKGKEVFTIEESLVHLHYYIRIQQLRFLDSFTVEYRIAEETKQIPILKLLLQPLVENAILHGMEGRASDGRLIISSWIEHENMVCISVQDNGQGLEKDRLHYIQNELMKIGLHSVPSLTQDEGHVKDLFGLRNVYIRMKLYYGKESHLEIDSLLEIGTTVTVKIPLDRCRLNNPPVIDQEETEGELQL